MPPLTLNNESSVEDYREELKDILRGLLLACQTNKRPSIRSGEDFYQSTLEIKEPSKDEKKILSQICEAFTQAKPVLLHPLCELSEILINGFLDPQTRPGLVQLQGITANLLLQIAEEKHKQSQKKKLALVAAEILGEMNPVRIKTIRELEEGFENIPGKTNKEALILESVLSGLKKTNDKSLFHFACRILAAFHHTEKRPKIAAALEEMTPEELQEMATELLGKVPVDTKRLIVDQVRALLQTGDPLNEEVITRSFARKKTRAVLGSGHLKMGIGNLKTELDSLKEELNKLKIKFKENETTKEINSILENISKLEKHSFGLLENVAGRLEELEKTKNGKKDRSQALKDFAGKINSVLLNLGFENFEEMKDGLKTRKIGEIKENTRHMEAFAKLLNYIGNLDLLALVVNMKKLDDLKAVIEEIKEQRQNLTRWTDDDSSRLLRVLAYFERGTCSINEIKDEEAAKKKQRSERFQKALEDCASLIAIGLCAKTEQRQSAQCKARIEKYIEQIEVDAQGLETGGLNDDAVALEQTIKHIRDTITDPSERERAINVLRLTKENGYAKGSAEAIRLADDEARREAEKAKNEGFNGFGDLSFLDDALGED